MGETQKAAKVLAWCLLVHGAAGPGYSQRDSTPLRGSRGNTFRARVAGTTNTQAVLAYAAPDGAACTVKVSESNTLSPLVHDVDATLYSGADSDARTSSVNNGTSRVVIVGARLSQKALDGNTYSRALQTNTLHYYRVACGASVASGTFTTANIPLQMTYQDLPQQDLANPGSVVMPTLLTANRTQTIIDPHTGALIKRVSLPGDVSGSGPYMYSGGFVRVCGDSLVGPGPGYLCAFAQGNGGYGVLYYIIPSTGEARFLGYNNWGVAYPYINAADSRFYVQSGNDVYVHAYTGDYSANAPGAYVRSSSTLLISGLSAAIHAFDTTFDPAVFGCSIGPSIGDYLQVKCLRGNQDTYGWSAIVRVSTGSLIAATPVYNNIKTRWCAIHQSISLYDQPALFINLHGMVGGSGLGGGPYTTKYSGGTTLPAGSTTLAVTGEPACVGCGADSSVPAVQVGDVFTFTDSYEAVRVVNKTSPTSWVITATTTRHSSGVALAASCAGVAGQTSERWPPIYWRFLDDPRGVDPTNMYYIADQYWPSGGHDDMTTGLRITESTGYPIEVGDLMTQLNQPITRTIPNSVTFAGVLAECYGNNCAAHPSTAGPGVSWFTDYFQWDTAGEGGTLANVSGQVYKYTNTRYPLDSRHYAIEAAIGAVWVAGGPHFLLDVSGPGVILDTGTTDNYKYCIANAANECFGGAAKGDVYINIPGAPNLACGNTGVCMGNFPAFGGAVLQIGSSPGQTRVISGGLVPVRSTGGSYPTAKALADGSWQLYTIGDVHYNTPSQLVMAKIPPLTAQDAVDRTTFVRAPISIATPRGQGIVSAAIEFGYLEQGTPAQHYCTSRREACVAVSSMVTDATPFWYEGTDSYARALCAQFCTITLPVLPAHVAYYQVKFYDAQGAVVGLGDRGVSVEAAAVNPGGGPANAIE
jgi:hypothetical protein